MNSRQFGVVFILSCLLLESSLSASRQSDFDREAVIPELRLSAGRVMESLGGGARYRRHVRTLQIVTASGILAIGELIAGIEPAESKIAPVPGGASSSLSFLAQNASGPPKPSQAAFPLAHSNVARPMRAHLKALSDLVIRMTPEQIELLKTGPYWQETAHFNRVEALQAAESAKKLFAFFQTQDATFRSDWFLQDPAFLIASAYRHVTLEDILARVKENKDTKALTKILTEELFPLVIEEQMQAAARLEEVSRIPESPDIPVPQSLLLRPLLDDILRFLPSSLNDLRTAYSDVFAALPNAYIPQIAIRADGRISDDAQLKNRLGQLGRVLLARGYALNAHFFHMDSGVSQIKILLAQAKPKGSGVVEVGGIQVKIRPVQMLGRQPKTTDLSMLNAFEVTGEDSTVALIEDRVRASAQMLEETLKGHSPSALGGMTISVQKNALANRIILRTFAGFSAKQIEDALVRHLVKTQIMYLWLEQRTSDVGPSPVYQRFLGRVQSPAIAATLTRQYGVWLGADAISEIPYWALFCRNMILPEKSTPANTAEGLLGDLWLRAIAKQLADSSPAAAQKILDHHGNITQVEALQFMDALLEDNVSDERLLNAYRPAYEEVFPDQPVPWATSEPFQSQPRNPSIGRFPFLRSS